MHRPTAGRLFALRHRHAPTHHASTRPRYDAPIIRSISPLKPYATNSTLTVVGENFGEPAVQEANGAPNRTSVLRVLVGGGALSGGDVTLISDRRLVCELGRQRAGTVDVVVEAGGQRSNASEV